MGKIRVRKETGKLQFDFFYQGVRCREQSLLDDTSANRQRLESFMAQIDQEIKQDCFQYEKYFPNSKNIARVAAVVNFVPEVATVPAGSAPRFKTYSDEWYLESEVAWKISYQKTVKGNIECHLDP